MNLLEFREHGIYCPRADIYIDPWYPVPKAVITHAHSDHARPGNQYYLAHHHSATILKLRLGPDINLQTLGYGEKLHLNGVTLSLHPAGHIWGSAQVRLEYQGEVWVVSGDYKLEDDKVCAPFEPVPCHTFITESTFGLPIFKWKPQEEIFREMNQWWKDNRAEGLTSILMGYSLGKAQHCLMHLDPSIGKIFVHGAIQNVNEALRQSGAPIPLLQRASLEHKEDFAGSLVLAPMSVMNSSWLRKFKPYSTAVASGWMNLRGAKRRKPVDRGFILSDHADWDSLLLAVKETGAQRIYVTHGYKSVFSRYLQEQGYEAYEVDTLWEGESAEEKYEVPDEAS